MVYEIFDHSFNFSACNCVVHNFYFFLVQSWKIELYKESVHFFQVMYFIAIYLFIIVSYREKAMAPHSSTLAWKTPSTKEPGRLQSMGSLSRTRLSNFTFTFHFHALEKEMATHSSVLAWRIPGAGGAWWAAVYGVAQSRTRLKRLSSSSSSSSSSTMYLSNVISNPSNPSYA